MTKRVALVTGGMGGIGTAICRRLASANGSAVVANCLPEYAHKDSWLEKVRAEGFDNVYAAEGDVANFESVGDMVKRIESDIGPVDILVNNAGIVRDNMLHKMSPGDWIEVINTNLNSAFNVTKHVVDGMCTRGWGRIVNIVTSHFTMVMDRFSPYGPSKAALEAALAAQHLEQAGTASPSPVQQP